MRITFQPAFLLHLRPYRETSAILELFTRDYGRIAAVARGVRGPRSQLKSLLQPFSPLLLSWQGKSDLMTLVSAEANGIPFHLRGDCLLSGFYLNELMIRLLQKQDSHPELYTVYHETLVELQAQTQPEKTLRYFEKKLLEALGYGLQQQIEAEHFYRYVPEEGLVMWEGELVGADIFSGKSLLALLEDALSDETSLQDAKRLMRLIISQLLGGKPLASRKLFIEV